ncbi:hypothetical protein Taro_031857 [Colocasia esculenta]|uniref:Uncharacterized protein n=1 Tax=Colocasia esculenta TaxID=4460 RepID=A0A843VR48_COLES|nr:hypothetical protein [Colocasia esculenta]
MQVMPAVINVMKENATLVTLVKPQFEARRFQKKLSSPGAPQGFLYSGWAKNARPEGLRTLPGALRNRAGERGNLRGPPPPSFPTAAQLGRGGTRNRQRRWRRAEVVAVTPGSSGGEGRPAAALSSSGAGERGWPAALALDAGRSGGVRQRCRRREEAAAAALGPGGSRGQGGTLSRDPNLLSLWEVEELLEILKCIRKSFFRRSTTVVRQRDSGGPASGDRRKLATVGSRRPSEAGFRRSSESGHRGRFWRSPESGGGEILATTGGGFRRSVVSGDRRNPATGGGFRRPAASYLNYYYFF